MRYLLVAVFAALFLCSAIPSQACTTMIATKGATADGSMLVAHSDDDELSDLRSYSQVLRSHAPGDQVTLRIQRAGTEIRVLGHPAGALLALLRLALRRYGDRRGAGRCDGEFYPSLPGGIIHQ